MLVKVKVIAGAKKEKIIKKDNNSFEVWVKEKPIKGTANRAVLNCLTNYLKLDKEKIRLIKGFRERNKIFEIKS